MVLGQIPEAFWLNESQMFFGRTFDVLPNSRIIMQKNRLRFLVKHLLLGVNHRKLEKKGFPCYQNRETEGAAELCFPLLQFRGEKAVTDLHLKVLLRGNGVGDKGHASCVSIIIPK